MRTLVKQITIIVDSIISRKDQVEERMSEMKDKIKEILYKEKKIILMITIEESGIAKNQS
jgi:hypothetical protein